MSPGTIKKGGAFSAYSFRVPSHELQVYCFGERKFKTVLLKKPWRFFPFFISATLLFCSLQHLKLLHFSIFIIFPRFVFNRGSKNCSDSLPNRSKSFPFELKLPTKFWYYISFASILSLFL